MRPMPEQIRETRKARGMTQSELALAADVGEATVRRIERGESPSMDSLESVARALGLSITLVTVAEADTPADGRGKGHEPDTAAVGGSAGLAHEGA